MVEESELEAAQILDTSVQNTREGEEHYHASGENDNNHTPDNKPTRVSQADGKRHRQRSSAVDRSWQAPRWKCKGHGFLDVKLIARSHVT
jgi:hypothetical protein